MLPGNMRLFFGDAVAAGSAGGFPQSNDLMRNSGIGACSK